VTGFGADQLVIIEEGEYAMTRIGVVFPQTEIGNDPSAIRNFAQIAEALGYSHILAYDHVLGANPDRQPRLQGPYTYEHPFHEPFVLFSYMASSTESIEFVTGILILPQRQTALVAKQAAALDVLSGGRLRLGVGIGWNWVEYEALGQDFGTRGRRVEEQVTLLRQLWTHPLVSFDGQWDKIPDAGLNPLPVQRPIPIWFGGHAEPVLRRVATMGDGWLPNYRTAAEARPSLNTIGRYLDQAGRSWDDIGLEPRIAFGQGQPSEWAQQISQWQEAGATHLSINTMNCGFDTPAKHFAALEAFASAILD
jgi:probable F420-dependent oxidoreductase